MLPWICSYLRIVQGGGEARTEAYQEYDEGALELPTLQYSKYGLVPYGVLVEESLAHLLKSLLLFFGNVFW